jgi:hypothetical protein
MKTALGAAESQGLKEKLGAEPIWVVGHSVDYESDVPGGIPALVSKKKKFLPGTVIAAMGSWLAEAINVTVCRHGAPNKRATNKE